MIYKIGNVDDVETIPQLTDDAKKAVTKFAKILTEMYGKDRDIDHDYGGYVLYATKGTNAKDIKAYFDYDDFPLEFAELFGDDICAARGTIDKEKLNFPNKATLRNDVTYRAFG